VQSTAHVFFFFFFLLFLVDTAPCLLSEKYRWQRCEFFVAVQVLVVRRRNLVVACEVN
jgi:hypothetical protein